MKSYVGWFVVSLLVPAYNDLSASQFLVVGFISLTADAGRGSEVAPPEMLCRPDSDALELDKRRRFEAGEDIVLL